MTLIMSEDEERFMAFTGLKQWAQGVVLQAKRITAAFEPLLNVSNTSSTEKIIYIIHCEQHYFVVAAYKVLEYRDWAQSLGLCKGIDFTEIDNFPRQDLKDLRNMWEHMVEYFQGKGHEKEHWVVKTPEYTADASSTIGAMIGGRLDYIKYADAVERLLTQLDQQPIPYPKHDLNI